MSSPPCPRILDWLRDGLEAQEVPRIALDPSAVEWPHCHCRPVKGVSQFRADVRPVPGPVVVHGGVLPCREYLCAYLFSAEGVAQIDAREDMRNARDAEVS